MRELGAQALRRICELDLKVLGLECASKLVRILSRSRRNVSHQLQARLLESVDVVDVHGALAGLTSISEAFRVQGSKDNAINRQKV